MSVFSAHMSNIRSARHFKETLTLESSDFSTFIVDTTPARAEALSIVANLSDAKVTQIMGALRHMQDEDRAEQEEAA